MATTITAGNSTNGGAAIASDNTGILELKTGSGAGTTAVTVNASQNVGIGTTLPTSFGATSKSLHVVSANTGYGTVLVDSNAVAVGQFYGTTDGTPLVLVGSRSNHPFLFSVNNTERGRFDTSGNFQFNSGYGSVAIAYGCRAWVNFNGTGTPSIRATGNVTSITLNGTGDYTLNFTNAMPDANYAAVCGVADGNTVGNRGASGMQIGTMASGSFRFAIYYGSQASPASNGAASGAAATVCVSIFR